MKKDTVIGLIYRFDKNDYQISLTDFSESDQQTLQEIFMKYEDSWSCIRGNKNTSIDDANIDYWERDVEEKKMDTPNYLIEFPDYDGDFYLPEGWVDNSWHNDICPHAEKRSADESIIAYLWQEYVDADKRETPNGNRYVLIIENNSDVIFQYDTDDIEIIKILVKGINLL